MREKLERSGGFFGIGGIAVMAFLYFIGASQLAPWWAVVLLGLVWLVHLVLGCLWFTRRPILALLLPFSLFAIWLGAMIGGQRLLGWTD